MTTLPNTPRSPPSPIRGTPSRGDDQSVTKSDLLWLAGLFALMFGLAASAWAIAPVLGIGAIIGGLFVALESWFSGLTFLRRHPSARPMGRGLIFLAALVPWLIGLGFTAALMWGLFLISDMMVG